MMIERIEFYPTVSYSWGIVRDKQIEILGWGVSLVTVVSASARAKGQESPSYLTRLM